MYATVPSSPDGGSGRSSRGSAPDDPVISSTVSTGPTIRRTPAMLSMSATRA